MFKHKAERSVALCGHFATQASALSRFSFEEPIPCQLYLAGPIDVRSLLVEVVMQAVGSLILAVAAALALWGCGGAGLFGESDRSSPVEEADSALFLTGI